MKPEMKPEEYFTKEELEYLKHHLDSMNQCVSVHENSNISLKFPPGEIALILTFQHVLKTALKLHG